MIIADTYQNKPLTLSLKSNCITISIGEPDSAEVFSYDLQGRMWSAFVEGLNYRRGLDGRMLRRWRNQGEARQREWLPQTEALAIENYAQQRLTELPQLDLPTAVQTVLENIFNFDSVADAAHYHAIYRPVGILPPDQYMAVVLQATEGCSFNTCTFCTFYKNIPFRIRSAHEFRAHALAVRDFLGAGLNLRRGVFLGDANALVVPMPKLLPLFDTVNELYAADVYAFLDGFSGEKKSAGDYAELQTRGLRRVYIGLESGNADLLKFLRKPGTPQDAIEAVKAIKAGGVGVGIIMLLGAGGAEYAAGHVRDSIDVLNAMPLDEQDILYFSELVISDDMPYAQQTVTPLSQVACLEQGESIRSRLQFVGKPPKISRYDIREFIY